MIYLAINTNNKKWITLDIIRHYNQVKVIINTKIPLSRH